MTKCHKRRAHMADLAGEAFSSRGSRERKILPVSGVV